MTFRNPIPVAVALVELQGTAYPAFLGVIRARAPGKGGIALPGGYVDEGETVETAVAREMLEETGLQTEPTDWEVKLTKITPENRLLVFCELRYSFHRDVIHECVLNPEVLGFCAIEPGTPLVFPVHQLVVNEWFAKQCS